MSIERTKVEALVQTLQSLGATALEELENQFSLLDSSVRGLPEALQDWSNLADSIEQMSGAFAMVENRIDVKKALVADLIQIEAEEIASSLAGTLSNCLNEVNDALDEDFPGIATRVFAEFGQLAEDAKDRAETCIKELGDALGEDVAERSGRIVDYASEQLVEAIDDAADLVLDRAIDDIAEAVETITMSAQAGVALQPVIAPISPQLMVLKPAIPAIKSALEALQLR